MAICKPRKQVSEATKPLETLIWIFSLQDCEKLPPPKKTKQTKKPIKIFLLLKLLSLWYFVVAVQVD